MTGGDRAPSARTATKVSVIVPVFNGERFLTDAIQSVFAQDHRPLEVIVVDDGSTDGSAEAAGSFEGVIVVRIEHAGPAIARNAGLSVATGDVVTFLDADDRMTEGRLSSQLAYLDGHADVGCVLTRQQLSVEPGAAPIPSRRVTNGLGEPSVGSMLIRRETLERVGGLDAGSGTEWMELLFRLQDAGVRIEVAPQVGLVRRVHDDNRSRDVGALRNGLTKAIREHLVRRRAGGTT